MLSGVLFDLDGTLLDSAPDYIGALNQFLLERQEPPVPFQKAREYVSMGAWALLRVGLQREPDRARDTGLRKRLLEIYLNRITQESSLFSGVETVLNALDNRGIPWGIVTNKPGHLTAPLLDHFGLTRRSGCSVSGDTLAVAKPNPEPILYACRAMDIDPQRAIMVGDAKPDIDAGRAAGTRTVLCRFGYIPPEADWKAWDADVVIDSMPQLLDQIHAS